MDNAHEPPAAAPQGLNSTFDTIRPNGFASNPRPLRAPEPQAELAPWREMVCVEVVLAPLSYSDEGDAPARQVRQGRERAVGSVPPLTASRHRGPRVWRPSTSVRAADVCPTEHGGHRGGGGPRRGVRTHEQRCHPRPRPSPDPQRWDSGGEGP